MLKYPAYVSLFKIDQNSFGTKYLAACKAPLLKSTPAHMKAGMPSHHNGLSGRFRSESTCIPDDGKVFSTLKITGIML